MQFWESIRGAIASACINEPTTYTEIGKRIGACRATISAFMTDPNRGMTPVHLDRLLKVLRLRVEVFRK